MPEPFNALSANFSFWNNFFLFWFLNVGTPDDAFLNQPIGATDHPFLRMHGPTLNQLEGRSQTDVARVADDLANFKLTGTDSDMEYYEKRYQQRVSLGNHQGTVSWNVFTAKSCNHWLL